MNLQEYNKVKDLSYNSYCEYLLTKYGPVPYEYGNKKNRPGKEGLFIHHMDEDKVSSLCSKENQDIYPHFQESDRLVYANYLEHALLHIMIGEETVGSRNLGLHGANLFIIPGLRSCFDNDRINNPKWPSIYYDLVKENKDVFELLFDRYNKTVEDCDLVIDHNKTLYLQVERCLQDNNKALVVLGTGLGKTTTALQYLWKHQCKGLVIGPNNLIKSGWECYGDWVDTTTYQSFANTYKDIDYSQYGLVILDEAHHIGYDEESNRGAEIWSKGIRYILKHNIKVLGLTATPDRNDGVKLGGTLFNNCVCEGMAVEDAIEKHIIHPFSYVTAIYDTDKLVQEVKDKYYSEDEECKKLFGQLDLAINNTITVRELFAKYMPKDTKRKGIVFIQEIADKEYALDIFKQLYPNMEFRAIDSKMNPEEVEANRKWFEETDEGYLMAVNMISEGAHYKGVNTLIMFRKTQSYLVYTQQLGRIITLMKDKNPNAIVFDLVNNVENIRYNDRKLNRHKKEEHSISKIIKALENLKSEQIIIADETRDIVDCIRNIKQYYKTNLFWQDWEKDIITKYYPEWNKIQSEMIRYAKENFNYKLEDKRYHFTLDAIKGYAFKLGLLEKRKKQIICIETQEIFESITSAKNKGYKFDMGILKPIKAKNNQGYHFAYLDDKIKQEALKEYIGKIPDNLSSFRWNEEMDNILKEWYGKITIKELKERFPALKDRDIVHRARILGLSKNKPLNWTEKEDKIIIDFYSILGANIVKKLPNRTLTQIQGRAAELKVKYDRNLVYSMDWTEEELNILKLNYSSKGPNQLTILIPRKSRHLIIKKAEELNLTYNKKQNWTEEEISLLKKFYNDKNLELIQEKLSNRTLKQIQAKAKFLKLGSRRGKKKVLCIETGVIYNSCSDAIKAFNCYSIEGVVRGKLEYATPYKYHFKYID